MVLVLERLYALSCRRDTTAGQRTILHDCERLAARALYWLNRGKQEALDEINRHIMDNIGDGERIVRQIDVRCLRGDSDPAVGQDARKQPPEA